MSGNNVQNGNEVQNNSKATRNHSERMNTQEEQIAENSTNPNVSNELNQKRAVVNKKSLSWLDDDDEIEEKSDLNRDTNQKKTDALIEDVEDPMADLRAAWNSGAPAKMDGSRHSKDDQQELLDKKRNLFAQEGEAISEEEKKALSEINERILSSFPEEKVFTEEETNLINAKVADALQDEKAEEAELDANKGVDANLQNIALPDVEIFEEAPMKQPDNPLSWLDEDNDVDSEPNLNSGAKASSKQDVEDPMADLRAAWNSGERAKIRGNKALSKDEQQKFLDKAWNLIAQTGEEISEEEKKALSEINERILSSFPEEKVFTEEESKQIDQKVAEALKDEKDEKDEKEKVAQESQSVKPDLHDVFLPDVELDEEEQVENKDEPINLPHSKAILFDDEDVTEDKEINPDVIAKESDDHEPLQIPDFYDRWEKRLNNEDVTKDVKSEMSNIFKAAGITDTEKLPHLVEDAYFLATDGIKNIYVSDAVFKAKMSFDTPIFMTQAYESLREADLSLKDRIITAQKIADVMLKNYSPIAFANGMLDQYADNYVLNNKDLFKDFLEDLKLPQDQIEPLMQEVEHTLQYGPEIKHPEQIPDQEANLNKEQEEVAKEAPIQESPAIEEKKPVNDESRVAVYTEKLKAYNNMYKLNVDSNKIAGAVSDAWELITSGDKQKMADGMKIMNDVFKDTLKKAFDVEKDVAYDEHRLPEFAEIIKSTNELMRSAMYGFTDMYHNPNRKDLFSITAFGGLNAKDISELTTGKSLWSMDQKSDEAWDLQAQNAKNIAENWLKEDRPYEKMINEMNALIKANEKNRGDLQEVYNKLTAAEWMLTNDEKMMVEDPYDPYNPIPNWGNRYWKALTETREALGIPKHSSMRDLIQLDYAQSAKAVENRNYNEKQIFDGVLDPGDREFHDSLDMQKEQFAIQSATVQLTKPHKNAALEDDMTSIREPYPVEQLNQRNIMKNEPKNDNWILVESAHQELTITSQANAK